MRTSSDIAVAVVASMGGRASAVDAEARLARVLRRRDPHHAACAINLALIAGRLHRDGEHLVVVREVRS